MTSDSGIEIRRGLMNVYFDRTESCLVDGEIGKLLYRGYNIHDLAEKSTFEEVMYLLLFGELPNYDQLGDFSQNMIKDRTIPEEIFEIIKMIKDSHPMDVLRTCVSALSNWDPEVSDNSQEAIIRKGLRLTAKAPTIVCAHHRIRNGLDPVAPSTTLNHAGNFLYMLFDKEPSAEEQSIMDVDFILHAEHGSNASAFAARVAASTQSDLHSAVVAGIGTLKGPAHGGAAEEVMKMAQDIGSPDNAEKYAKDLLGSGGRVMGFGHRVYKAEDPRARHMKQRSRDYGIEKGQPQWFEILTSLQKVMEPYGARGIHVNVDFFAGSVYSLMGIPEDLFISIFALGRVPGWTLNVAEQYENNILLRPRLEYVGPMDLDYKDIDAR